MNKLSAVMTIEDEDDMIPYNNIIDEASGINNFIKLVIKEVEQKEVDYIVDHKDEIILNYFYYNYDLQCNAYVLKNLSLMFKIEIIRNILK